MVVNALNNNTFLFSKTGLMVVKALNNAILLLNLNMSCDGFSANIYEPIKINTVKMCGFFIKSP